MITHLCVLKNNYHSRLDVMPHLSLTTSTNSLSPISTSPIFPTVKPAHTRSMVLDPKKNLRCSTAERRINTNPISHKSTSQRAESSQSKKHENHVASTRLISMTHFKLVHKVIQMPQAMKIPDAKAAADKEWKKLETCLAWDLRNVKSKKEVILEAQSVDPTSFEKWWLFRFPEKKSRKPTGCVDKTPTHNTPLCNTTVCSQARNTQRGWLKSHRLQ